MKTLETNSRITELKERHERELKKIEAQMQIESALPESLPLPTISNISDGQIRAWLSFSPAYGQDARTFAIGVLTALENAGAKPVAVSLCKWDNYRRHAEPGLCDDIPEEQGRKKLTDVEPIAPLWVEPCQYTGVEAHCFYEIAGAIYKIGVKAPLATHLSCRRIKNMGGWRFDGACSVKFPDKWHSLHTENGESVANISQHTRGYRDTEQGITGVIYWQPLTEQAAFPLTPAQMLAMLF